MALVYDLTPGDNLQFILLDGCAVYNSGYGVSGAVNSGELGGWTTPNGKKYLSIGTFNSTSYVIDREARFYLNMTNMDYFEVTMIAGNDNNGGERVNNFGESLYIKSPTNVVRTLLLSGQDAGLAYPDVDGGGAWVTRTYYLNADEKNVGLWTIYAYSIQQPEFSGTGGIYDSNVNAGDRYGINRIAIYGTPPTTLTYYRINDQSVTAEINPGDPITFTWDTTINDLATATSVSINQGIGNVTPVNGGSLTIAGPTVDTIYTMTVVGNTGTITQSVTVKMIIPDNIPDAFTFPSVQGADLSTTYTTSAVNISGLGPGISVTVSATNGAETSVNGGAFSTANKTISNNQSLAVRMVSSSSYDTAKTTTVTAGTTSTSWVITTKSPPVQVPNTFTFTPVTGAALQTYAYSNIVTITGITAPVTVTAPANGTYSQSSVNGGAWSSAAKTISNGQTLQLRILTSNVLGDIRTTSVAVGDSPQIGWEVTNVLVADGSPDYFQFTPKNNQALSTNVSSDAITITGINVPTAVSTTNGATISINGGAYLTSPQNINNNETLSVRLLSSADPGVSVSTEVTIGGLTNTFTVTTTTAGDTNPDAFSFVNKTNQPPSTITESNAVVITGITSPSPVTITAGGQFSINGGSWVTSGSINNGDTLKIRLTSSAALGGTVSTTITIG